MAALLAIHIILQVWHYQWDELPWLLRQFFDVDEEDSLPTWYSATALLLASGLLFLISRSKRTAQDRWVRYWYGLAFAFAALSMDEVAGLHETFNSVVEFRWGIAGGIFAALFGLAYVRFLLHLSARTRWLFIISGCIFVAGAVGVEMSTDWYDDEGLLNTLPYNLWNAVEEGLEMAGVVLFIYAILNYMSRNGNADVDVIMEG